MIFYFYSPITPIPVTARSEAWFCGRSLAGISGSNPAGGMDGWMSIVCVIFCQVEVSVTGGLLVQRSPTEHGVSECDLETLSRRRPRSTRAVEP